MDSLPRFLLTNDDGFDAPGMTALTQAIEGLGSAQVIAPNGPQSGCSHSVTTHGPIPVIDRGDRHFAVKGTPADCVRLGLHHLTGPVDWVISGINAGGNLGVDVHHSGTVAAVREAVIHGIPGIAISHYFAKGRTVDWNRAAIWAKRVIAALMIRPIPPETFWNVNLPHPDQETDEPRIVYCSVDPSPLPIHYELTTDTAEYRGNYQGRARRPGWDVDVCFSGQIAVSLVHLMASVERIGNGETALDNP